MRSQTMQRFSRLLTARGRPLLERWPVKPAERAIHVNTVEEKRWEVDGVNINYVTSGHGPINVLCCPGIGGFWKSDFEEVLQKFDPSKFSIVAWDPPGFGKSRPPDRDFTNNANIRDAQIAFKLMEKLKQLPFSVIGWCDGGVTALRLGHQQRETTNVKKLVVFGTSTYISAELVHLFKAVPGIIDVRKWPEKNLRPYVEMYGEDYFAWLWSTYMQSRAELFEKENGNKCREILPYVPQPVLLFHAGKDVFVPNEHAEYLFEKLPNARILYNSEAKHNLHKVYFDWFKQNVEAFLQADGNSFGQLMEFDPSTHHCNKDEDLDMQQMAKAFPQLATLMQEKTTTKTLQTAA